MDVRCEKCNTEYDFDDARITEAGVTVKCTQCGFVFKVKKRAAARPTDELPPELSNVDKTREWKIRQSTGNIYTCRELTTLQKWIVERKVSREDEISLTGETWKRLGNIPELAGFFMVVEQAAKAAVYEQQIQAGTYVPSSPSMAAAPPAAARPVVDPTVATPPAAAWSGLEEPSAPHPVVPFDEEAPGADDLAAIRGSSTGRNVGIAAALLVAAGLGYLGYTSLAHHPDAAPPAPVVAAPVAVPPPVAVALAPPPVVAPVVAVAPPPSAPTAVDAGAVAAVLAVAPPVAPVAKVKADAPAAVDAGAPAPTAVAVADPPAKPAVEKAAVEKAAVEKAAVEKVEKVEKPEKPEKKAPPADKPDPEEAAAEKPPADKPAADKPAKAPHGSFESLMAQGRSLEQHDKAKKALDYFLQALEVKPTSAEAWVGKANCLVDLQRTSEAETAFREALTYAPGYSDASLGLASIYKSSGRREDAVKQYKAYLSQNPNGADAEMARRNLKDLSD